MAYLVLVRHGISEYNEKGLWAGWADPKLTDEGRKEAEKAGMALKDITFDFAYTSALARARDTLQIILETLNQHAPVIEDQALNERNYGDFTGKNKWEIKKTLGEEEFMKLRRSWDYPVPHGESLKQVYERIIPYLESQILPQLKSGKNVIISSSGNALRALVKFLEDIQDDKIASLEIATGEIYVYTIDEQGKVVGKEQRASRPNVV